MVDAIRYVTHNGCVWRALPADFPPWRTVYGIYQRWNASGATLALHDALRALARQAAGRNAEPTAAVIDSQSVRAAPTVPRSSRGWDAAKKVNGRKRHIAVDTSGLLLEVLVTTASTQDRAAARPLLFNLTLAWITSYRRCARDYERLPAHHEAMILWAMITLMTRRLARPG